MTLNAVNITRRRNDKVVDYIYLINLFYLQHSYRTKELIVCWYIMVKNKALQSGIIVWQS